MLRTLALYFAAVLQDGDYENDWRTHLPHTIRAIVEHIGWVLAEHIGQYPALHSAVPRMLGDVLSCGDPALPAQWTPAMVPVWHALTRIYDALISVGVC